MTTAVLIISRRRRADHIASIRGSAKLMRFIKSSDVFQAYRFETSGKNLVPPRAGVMHLAAGGAADMRSA
jgi:hypothetical protein